MLAECVGGTLRRRISSGVWRHGGSHLSQRYLADGQENPEGNKSNFHVRYSEQTLAGPTGYVGPGLKA
ncbi:hypothetical protein MCEMSE15_00177 [Fimbriimonadaceae bacterium]